jgi:uncharacterized membrane protein YdbT with pleckstrin-like domain
MGATFITVENSTLLRMQKDQFFLMMAAYPSLRKNLEATTESRRIARSKHFRFLGADEVIEYVSQKHDMFLLRGLLLPIILSIGSIPVLVFSFSRVGSPFMIQAMLVLGTLMLIAGILWGIWSWIDWGNDYYVVTSRRVIWLEKVIGLYESRREAPLETILSVNSTSSQLGRIFGYGDVNVRTFTGGILMRNMRKPSQFATFVEGYKKRAVILLEEEEARAMEQDLKQALTRFTVNSEVDVETPSLPPPVPILRKEVKQITFREWWRNFLKVRYEEGNTITYRKHWFMLLLLSWKPVLGFILLFVGTYFLWRASTDGGTPLVSGFIWVSLILLFFTILSGWLLYEYLDWSNDIYRLTPEQIHDIEKKPLGQEMKKTASLESIQSIEHERENLLGIILNYGTVIINVGQARFDFIGVFNPDQVHQDIADYREALFRRKRATQQAQERENMVNWLITYHKEAEEQGDLE